jgi:pyridoxamine 5'-phosphate oxidase
VRSADSPDPDPDRPDGAVRDLLRSLQALAGPYEPFETDLVAPTPEGQFLRWLQVAVAAGAPEPHAMTLSTVDAEGRPDSRVLLLKDVGPAGWCFATSRTSAKGVQLARRPGAALTFYWPALGRQVRVRGEVVDLGPEAAAVDFAARGRGARALALAERQSQVLELEADLVGALADAQSLIDAQPGVIAASWTLYAVQADVVEFWQADEARRHTRLQYVREGDGWSTRRLWP